MPQLDDTPANQVTDAIAEMREIAEGLDSAAPADVLARQKRLTRLATFLETFTKDEIPAAPSPYQAMRLHMAADGRTGSRFLPTDDPVAATPGPGEGQRFRLCLTGRRSSWRQSSNRQA
jgi:hypothetical protein